MRLSTKEKSRLLNKYGEWAVVTGASSGIGRELARQLSSAKFNLVLSGRNTQKLEQLANELWETEGVETRIVSADLSERLGATQVIDATSDLDIGLFIGAAGYGTSGKVHRSDLEAELDMIQVNVSALFRLSHHFAKRFTDRGRGGLILFSSMVAFQGVPYSANYAATKAYVQSLAEAMAIEMKGTGVDVLSAAPGPVASGFAHRADMQMNMAMTPEQVGVPILKALGRKNTVLPGFLTKFLVYSLRTAPRSVKVRLMKIVMGGMTAHQRMPRANKEKLVA